MSIFKKARIPSVNLYSGLSVSDTTMVVTPYPIDLDGNKIFISALGSNPQVTVDAREAKHEEIIGFTDIIDNGDGTATLIDLSRNLASSSLVTPGTGKQHGAGAVVIFSLNPQDTARIAALENNQTFTGLNTFSQSPVVPDPTTDLQMANKNYFNSKNII